MKSTRLTGGRLPLLTIARSARAIAAAARRAGRSAIVLDQFGDDDTRAMAQRFVYAPGDPEHGFDAAQLLELIAHLPETEGLVYGRGFDGAPEILEQIATVVPILGNPGAVVRRTKTSGLLADMLMRLGIPHPETRSTAPSDPAHWIIKRPGDSSGRSTRLASSGEAEDGAHYQRIVRGTAHVLAFAANGRTIRPIGFATRWMSPTAGHPYRSNGAAQPARIDPRVAAEVIDAVAAMAEESQLCGVNSVDLVIEGDRWWLLDVDPHPDAVLDLYDRSGADALMDLHLEAAAGRLPDDWRGPTRPTATATVWAPRAIRVPRELPWPGWAADRPPPGALIARGEVLCSARAAGRSINEAMQAVQARCGAMLDAFRINTGTLRRRRPTGLVGSEDFA